MRSGRADESCDRRRRQCVWVPWELVRSYAIEKGMIHVTHVDRNGEPAEWHVGNVAQTANFETFTRFLDGMLAERGRRSG